MPLYFPVIYISVEVFIYIEIKQIMVVTSELLMVRDDLAGSLMFSGSMKEQVLKYSHFGSRKPSELPEVFWIFLTSRWNVDFRTPNFF